MRGPDTAKIHILTAVSFVCKGNIFHRMLIFLYIRASKMIMERMDAKYE